MNPDLEGYCKQRTENAYRMHKWFQESMDRVRLQYPLPEINNGSDPVRNIPHDRMGVDSSQDSGE